MLNLSFYRFSSLKCQRKPDFLANKELISNLLKRYRIFCKINHFIYKHI